MLALYSILFIFFSTHMLGFYEYLPIGMYYDTFSNLAIALISIFFTGLIIIRNHGRIMIKARTKWWYYSVSIIVFIELINTPRIANHQSWILTLSEAFPYMAIVMVTFVLMSTVKTKTDLRLFTEFFRKVSVLLSILSVIQYLLFDFIKVFPMNSVIYRNGNPRIFIGGTVVFSIGFLITVNKFLFENRKFELGDFISIVLGVVRVFVVEQQRMLSAVMIGTLLLFLAKKLIAQKRVRILLSVSIVLCTILFMAFSEFGVVTKMFEGDFSASARMISVEFFLEKAKEYPLFGMGFITSSKSQDYASYSLLSTASGYHCQRSDVGIFGLLNMWGIVGVVWYAYYLYILFRNGREAENNDKHLCSIIAVFVALSSLTLIITDFQRVMLLPLLFVISYKYSTLNLERGNE